MHPVIQQGRCAPVLGKGATQMPAAAPHSCTAVFNPASRATSCSPDVGCTNLHQAVLDAWSTVGLPLGDAVGDTGTDRKSVV